MKQEIPLRIIISNRLHGVRMRVQRGRTELLPPAEESKDELVFEFNISFDLAGSAPNFLGKYSQGPKQDRFIYVNSGQRAGQAESCWDRRAKISLMNVTREQIQEVLDKTGALLQTEFDGVGRDGGPACASIKGLRWTVVNR